MLDNLSNLGSQVPAALLRRIESLGPASVTTVALLATLALFASAYRPFRDAIVFAYNCFLQPLGKTSNQAERLDRFYQHQASGTSFSTRLTRRSVRRDAHRPAARP